MKTIHVDASTEYDVVIGDGLLKMAADAIAAVTKPSNICIVSDHKVWALYGDTLKDRLTDAGFRCVGFSFPAGEQNKNFRTYGKLLEFLAENRLTRKDCVIALGGGVVGDLAGFAAATYLRGIDYIQIPTTLLAMVDSSVGGKTAIDLDAGKNLAGAFYQPKLVLCDIDTLNTLPKEIFLDGCVEVIKYGILFDQDFFGSLERSGADFDREAVIARCVELKRDIVTADEFEQGQRILLNLGHTVGHGIEAASGYSVSHGKAVAIGMAMVARACAAEGICSAETAQRINTLLESFGLPVSTEISLDAICHGAMADKKRQHDRIRMIVPKKIGQCEVFPLPCEELARWLKVGMAL